MTTSFHDHRSDRTSKSASVSRRYNVYGLAYQHTKQPPTLLDQPIANFLQTTSRRSRHSRRPMNPADWSTAPRQRLLVDPLSRWYVGVRADRKSSFEPFLSTATFPFWFLFLFLCLSELDLSGGRAKSKKPYGTSMDNDNGYGKLCIQIGNGGSNLGYDLFGQSVLIELYR